MALWLLPCQLPLANILIGYAVCTRALQREPLGRPIFGKLATGPEAMQFEERLTSGLPGRPGPWAGLAPVWADLVRARPRRPAALELRAIDGAPAAIVPTLWKSIGRDRRQGWVKKLRGVCLTVSNALSVAMGRPSL